MAQPAGRRTLRTVVLAVVDTKVAPFEETMT